jgi:hypothetical protein
MAFATDQKLEVYASATRGLAALEADPERQLKYADFIDLYAALDDDERRRYQALYPKEYATMLSFSERFIQQGQQHGQVEFLLHLLELKFGEVPASIRHRIEKADPDTLLQWSGRILTANTLDEVFRD